MGPPGSGNGTQAQLLSQILRVPHISTGELFRQHNSEQSELRLLAKTYLDTGELVPSAVGSENGAGPVDRRDGAAGFSP
jgi:adenylate kinase